MITHGGGDALWHAFNAIAILFQKQGVVATLLWISFNFCIIIAVTRMVISQDMLNAFKWSIASVFILNALLLPKINIVIIDRVAQFQRKVDNVPFILGFFASLSSQTGDFLAKKFDEVFAPVGLEYTETGIAMASKLVTKAKTLSLPNPDAAANLKTFVQQCMVPDVARGKYTLQEILEAEDLWQFLSQYASPIRGFPYRFGPKDTRIITCREAVKGSKEGWKSSVQDAAKRYGPEYFPFSRPEIAAEQLLSNLEVSYQYLTGLSLDASSILRQNMMRNIIADGLIELNAVNGTTDAIQSYAVARASEQQKTAYALQGEMASLSLSTLKVVVEILFYALFPIAATIAVFPGGWRVLREYLIAMFWIQSWAPMYAILNMIVNLYAKAKSVAAVTVTTASSTKAVLGWSTISRLSEANEWVSAVAGYAMMSIPFLSYGIFKYGAGALTQMASHFGSITQSSASHAAEEATTGSLSLGNTHFDNHSMSNTSAFKYDTNRSIATGKATLQETDGSLLHVMPDGTPIRDMRSSMGDVGGDIKVSDHIQSTLAQNAHKSLQSAIKTGQSATDNIATAINKTAEWREARAKSTDNSQSYSHTDSVGQESAWNKFMDLTESFANENNLSTRVAGRVFAELAGSITTKPIGFGFAEAQARISAGISVDGQKINDDTIRKAQSYSEANKMDELLKQSMTDAKEGRLHLGDSESQQWSDAVNANLNQAESQNKLAAADLSQAESYQEQANYYEQHGVSIDQSYAKPYQQYLVENFGIKGAHKIIANPALNADHMNHFAASKANALLEQYKSQRPTSESDIIDRHQQNLEQVKNFNDPQSHFVSNQAVVEQKRQDANLIVPVSTELQETVGNKINETNDLIRKQKIEMEQTGEIRKSLDAKPNQNIKALTKKMKQEMENGNP